MRSLRNELGRTQTILLSVMLITVKMYIPETQADGFGWDNGWNPDWGVMTYGLTEIIEECWADDTLEYQIRCPKKYRNVRRKR